MYFTNEGLTLKKAGLSSHTLTKLGQYNIQVKKLVNYTDDLLDFSLIYKSDFETTSVPHCILGNKTHTWEREGNTRGITYNPNKTSNLVK